MKDFSSSSSNKYYTLTQTEISEPEKPSVLRAKFSKSASVKLCGVSPRCTYLNTSMNISKVHGDDNNKKTCFFIGENKIEFSEL